MHVWRTHIELGVVSMFYLPKHFMDIGETWNGKCTKKFHLIYIFIHCGTVQYNMVVYMCKLFFLYFVNNAGKKEVSTFKGCIYMLNLSLMFTVFI